MLSTAHLHPYTVNRFSLTRRASLAPRRGDSSGGGGGVGGKDAQPALVIGPDKG